uniref:Uncharacterized protein n=1 Tax=Chromera velia CCMP2878 TaxID=1169474 RepID=A0A0G4HIT5_9ALVE|eukprot:Cvel_6984.t1-p1 / transcript=Cvel_6984.t1 / gene=Cvel_6984 / organism=Chromera_velia_CCMP2878 / gene_product=hypothetical protein / transcript_product=hypothetical protein / location=Cvel_scaffold355:5996-15188(-) / protein_length=2415 / sequence_SO=supercontig / SO=protein_coding / is_pseudo=false
MVEIFRFSHDLGVGRGWVGMESQEQIWRCFACSPSALLLASPSGSLHILRRESPLGPFQPDLQLSVSLPESAELTSVSWVDPDDNLAVLGSSLGEILLVDLSTEGAAAGRGTEWSLSSSSHRVEPIDRLSLSQCAVSAMDAESTCRDNIEEAPSRLGLPAGGGSVWLHVGDAGGSAFSVRMDRGGGAGGERSRWRFVDHERVCSDGLGHVHQVLSRPPRPSLRRQAAGGGRDGEGSEGVCLVAFAGSKRCGVLARRERRPVNGIDRPGTEAGMVGDFRFHLIGSKGHGVSDEPAPFGFSACVRGHTQGTGEMSEESPHENSGGADESAPILASRPGGRLWVAGEGGDVRQTLKLAVGSPPSSDIEASRRASSGLAEGSRVPLGLLFPLGSSGFVSVVSSSSSGGEGGSGSGDGGGREGGVVLVGSVLDLSVESHLNVGKETDLVQGRFCTCTSGRGRDGFFGSLFILTKSRESLKMGMEEIFFFRSWRHAVGHLCVQALEMSSKTKTKTVPEAVTQGRVANGCHAELERDVGPLIDSWMSTAASWVAALLVSEETGRLEEVEQAVVQGAEGEEGATAEAQSKALTRSWPRGRLSLKALGLLCHPGGHPQNGKSPSSLQTDKGGPNGIVRKGHTEGTSDARTVLWKRLSAIESDFLRRGSVLSLRAPARHFPLATAWAQLEEEEEEGGQEDAGVVTEGDGRRKVPKRKMVVRGAREKGGEVNEDGVGMSTTFPVLLSFLQFVRADRKEKRFKRVQKSEFAGRNPILLLEESPLVRALELSRVEEHRDQFVISPLTLHQPLSYDLQRSLSFSLLLVSLTASLFKGEEGKCLMESFSPILPKKRSSHHSEEETRHGFREKGIWRRRGTRRPIYREPRLFRIPKAPCDISAQRDSYEQNAPTALDVHLGGNGKANEAEGDVRVSHRLLARGAALREKVGDVFSSARTFAASLAALGRDDVVPLDVEPVTHTHPNAPLHQKKEKDDPAERQSNPVTPPATSAFPSSRETPPGTSGPNRRSPSVREESSVHPPTPAVDISDRAGKPAGLSMSHPPSSAVGNLRGTEEAVGPSTPSREGVPRLTPTVPPSESPQPSRESQQQLKDSPDTQAAGMKEGGRRGGGGIFGLASAAGAWAGAAHRQFGAFIERPDEMAHVMAGRAANLAGRVHTSLRESEGPQAHLASFLGGAVNAMKSAGGAFVPSSHSTHHHQQQEDLPVSVDRNPVGLRRPGSAGTRMSTTASAAIPPALSVSDFIPSGGGGGGSGAATSRGEGVGAQTSLEGLGGVGVPEDPFAVPDLSGFFGEDDTADPFGTTRAGEEAVGGEGVVVPPQEERGGEFVEQQREGQAGFSSVPANEASVFTDGPASALQHEQTEGKKVEEIHNSNASPAEFDDRGNHPVGVEDKSEGRPMPSPFEAVEEIREGRVVPGKDAKGPALCSIPSQPTVPAPCTDHPQQKEKEKGAEDQLIPDTTEICSTSHLIAQNPLLPPVAFLCRAVWDAAVLLTRLKKQSPADTDLSVPLFSLPASLPTHKVCPPLQALLGTENARVSGGGSLDVHRLLLELGGRVGGETGSGKETGREAEEALQRVTAVLDGLSEFTAASLCALGAWHHRDLWLHLALRSLRLSQKGGLGLSKGQLTEGDEELSAILSPRLLTEEREGEESEETEETEDGTAHEAPLPDLCLTEPAPVAFRHLLASLLREFPQGSPTSPFETCAKASAAPDDSLCLHIPVSILEDAVCERAWGEWVAGETPGPSAGVLRVPLTVGQDLVAKAFGLLDTAAVVSNKRGGVQPQSWTQWVARFAARLRVISCRRTVGRFDVALGATFRSYVSREIASLSKRHAMWVGVLCNLGVDIEGGVGEGAADAHRDENCGEPESTGAVSSLCTGLRLKDSQAAAAVEFCHLGATVRAREVFVRSMETGYVQGFLSACGGEEGKGKERDERGKLPDGLTSVQCKRGLVFFLLALGQAPVSVLGEGDSSAETDTGGVLGGLGNEHFDRVGAGEMSALDELFASLADLQRERLGGDVETEDDNESLGFSQEGSDKEEEKEKTSPSPSVRQPDRLASGGTGGGGGGMFGGRETARESLQLPDITLDSIKARLAEQDSADASNRAHASREREGGWEGVEEEDDEESWEASVTLQAPRAQRETAAVGQRKSYTETERLAVPLPPPEPALVSVSGGVKEERPEDGEEETVPEGVFDTSEVQVGVSRGAQAGESGEGPPSIEPGPLENPPPVFVWETPADSSTGPLCGCGCPAFAVKGRLEALTHHCGEIRALAEALDLLETLGASVVGGGEGGSGVPLLPLRCALAETCLRLLVVGWTSGGSGGEGPWYCRLLQAKKALGVVFLFLVKRICVDLEKRQKENGTGAEPVGSLFGMALSDLVSESCKEYLPRHTSSCLDVLPEFILDNFQHLTLCPLN